MERIEDMKLNDILDIKVPQDRIERLRQWTRPDLPEDTPQEVVDYLLSRQAQYVDIQYKRFLAGTGYTLAQMESLMQGSIDIHAHGGSEPFERIMMEDQMVRECMDAGMKAVVIKTWFTPSASRNALLMKEAERYSQEKGIEPLKIFGGITLNASVGGINPDAVRRCLRFPGMKYVWLPMVDSYHHRRVAFDDLSGQGLHIVDEHGHPLPEVKEVIRICADNNLTLASGHYPCQETGAVMDEALRCGVKHLEIVHPAHMHSKHSIAQMREAASKGIKLMLSGLGTLVFPAHESGPVYAVEVIRQVGAENLVYGSDFGQIHTLPHVDGARWMIKMLLAWGATLDEIRTVFHTAPAKHLELE